MHRTGLVEELDRCVVLLLERRDARVRLCSIGLQRVISVGCLIKRRDKHKPYGPEEHDQHRDLEVRWVNSH